MTTPLEGACKALVCGAALALIVFTAPAAAAEGLEGSWRGAGTVVLASGAIEKARCKANFTRQSGTLYGMSAVCATASTSVNQVAKVNRVGDNTYAGEFHNREYNISGQISIIVRANKISASLNGGGGTARFTLSR